MPLSYLADPLSPKDDHGLAVWTMIYALHLKTLGVIDAGEARLILNSVNAAVNRN